jgi:hypothetical protein
MGKEKLTKGIKNNGLRRNRGWLEFGRKARLRTARVTDMRNRYIVTTPKDARNYLFYKDKQTCGNGRFYRRFYRGFYGGFYRGVLSGVLSGGQNSGIHATLCRKKSMARMTLIFLKKMTGKGGNI